METREPDLKARMSDEDSQYGEVQEWIWVLILWKLAAAKQNHTTKPMASSITKFEFSELIRCRNSSWNDRNETSYSPSIYGTSKSVRFVNCGPLSRDSIDTAKN